MSIWFIKKILLKYIIFNFSWFSPKSLCCSFFKIIFNYHYYFFNIHTILSPLSSPLRPSPLLPIHSSVFSQKKAGLLWTSTKQVAVRLDATSHTKTKQGNSVWGRGSLKLSKESETSPALTVRSPPRRQATHLLYKWRGPTSVSCKVPGCHFSVRKGLWDQSSWFYGFYCDVLNCSISYNSSSFSSSEFSKLGLIFRYRSLHLFLLGAR